MPSPERKRNAYSHFRPGRVVDDRLNRIAHCVRDIINDGHKIYLPLHLFSEEIISLETKARFSTKPGEPVIIRPQDICVLEDNMSTDDYGPWSKLHILALKLLDIDPWVVSMFQSHYDLVQTARTYKSAWPAWRLYDIRRRQLVSGLKPMDISRYDKDLFSDITNELSAQTLADLRSVAKRADSARDAPRGSRSRNSAAGSATANASVASSSRNASAVTGGGAIKKLKFARCLACGSDAHSYDKDKRTQCDAKWLVWDDKLDNHKLPTNGEYSCWAYNSLSGCKSGSRCRRKDGHCCSLCGSATHGAQTCKA